MKMCKCSRLKSCKFRPRKRRLAFKKKLHAKKRSVVDRNLVQKLQDTGTQKGHADGKSLLCVKKQSEEDMDSTENYVEISPEMIVDSLRELSRWHDYILFANILNYIMRHYPVNCNLLELENELRRKLRDAEKAGMVTSDNRGRWRLNTNLEKLRHIPEKLISLFWEFHCNIISPLADKI